MKLPVEKDKDYKALALSTLVTLGALGAIGLGGGCNDGAMDGPNNDDVMPPGDTPKVDYPKGDIGFKVGQQVINMKFLWHPNGLADKGTELQQVSMADFYAKRKEGAKLLYLSGAAEWCGPCQLEARLINAVLNDKVYQCSASKTSCTCAGATADETAKNTCDFCADMTKKPADCQTYSEVLKSKGWDNALKVVQVVLQDNNYNRSDAASLERWEVSQGTRFSVGIDPRQQVSMYIAEAAVPQSLFIRLNDMVLQRQEVGTPSWGSQLMALLLGEMTKAAK